LRYSATAVGGILALIVHGRPAAAWVLALVVALVVSAIPAIAQRSLWLWQTAFIGQALRHGREIRGIVGAANLKAAAAWLERSQDAPAYDRYRVLGFIGHDEEAESLIPELPTSTPAERYWRAWAEIGRSWRAEGVLDVSPAAEILPALDAATRDEAEEVIWYARGLEAAAEDRPLTGLPTPRTGTLPAVGRFWVWWNRYWVARWLVGMFVLMSLVLVVIFR
jgi:hypothetical protein